MKGNFFTPATLTGRVKIAPDKITATAQAKIAGRMADIDLEGTIVEDGGGLYFRMTKLNIRNAIVGKAVLGDFFGDILLTKFSALPFNVEVDRVILQDGQVVEGQLTIRNPFAAP